MLTGKSAAICALSRSDQVKLILDSDRNVPPLPVPLLYFMEEREVWRGYLGGSVRPGLRTGIPPHFVV